jgi:hypothetical protein
VGNIAFARGRNNRTNGGMSIEGAGGRQSRNVLMHAAKWAD